MSLRLNDCALEECRQELLAQIDQLRDLRSGSLVKRYRQEFDRWLCQCLGDKFRPFRVIGINTSREARLATISVLPLPPTHVPESFGSRRMP